MRAFRRRSEIRLSVAPDGSEVGTRTFSGSVPLRYRFPELAPGATRLEKLEFQPASVVEAAAGASSGSTAPTDEEAAPPDSGEGEATEPAPPEPTATQRWGPSLVILRNGERIDARAVARSGGTTTVQVRGGGVKRLRDAEIAKIVPRR